VSGWVGVCSTKALDQNDLKLGTVVVLDTVLQPTDVGGKILISKGQGLD